MPPSEHEPVFYLEKNTALGTDLMYLCKSLGINVGMTAIILYLEVSPPTVKGYRVTQPADGEFATSELSNRKARRIARQEGIIL